MSTHGLTLRFSRAWFTVIAAALVPVGCSPKSTPATAGTTSKASAAPVRGPTMFPDLTSTLGVPPRQQFRLGGGQPGKFFVDILNNGPAATTIRVDRAGTIEDLGVAEPGATIRHQFAAGEGAIIVNRTDQEASLRVKVWGNIDIAMRYTPAE